MKKLIAKKDFIINSISFVKGDEININDIVTIKKLNEKGFIEPLDFKDLTILERELKYKKEEE